jgi:acyl-CoA reductase-like NAD-dependent aldehyde dehydrogenase
MALGFNLDEQLHYFHRELKAYPSLDYRKDRIRKIGRFLEDHEALLIKAVRSDLNRPQAEIFWGELAPIHQEIKVCLSNLSKWMAPSRKRRKWLSPVHWDARVETFYQPRGLSLIIGPWNYPIQLVLIPLIDSIAAGNLNTFKPSEYAPASAEVLKDKLGSYFLKEELAIFNGGPEVGESLVKQKFDVIFFTGGSGVAKDIMRAAAHQFPHFIFELGGKCPVILDDRIDRLSVALRRIVWGKMLNAGQTCVSPDFLCVPRQQLHFIKEKIIEIFERDFSNPELYSRIVNQKHFDRLQRLLDHSEVLWSGSCDSEKLQMGLQILHAQSLSDSAMQDEIFGPLLPLWPYDSKESLLEMISQMERPLAVYYFGDDEEYFNRLKTRTHSGALLRNDVVVHLSHEELPFGGIGKSGSGAYHGFFGFEAFSHRKAIESRGLKMDFKWRYSKHIAKMPRYFRRFL